MPRNLILKMLKEQFRKLNPNSDEREVEWEAFDYPCHYGSALTETRNANPQFKWKNGNEIKLSADDMEQQRIEKELEENEKSVKIKLKLKYGTIKGQKYYYVKGQVKKKIFQKYGERLCEELTVDWPVYEEVEDEQELDAPNALFDEKKSEEAEDYQEHPNALLDSLNEKKTKEDEEEEEKKQP